MQAGESQNGMVRILAGLDGHAVVATSALDQLFDGAKVRPVAPAADARRQRPVEKDIMHKLAELCVRRPVFATMLVLSLTVVGGFSFIGLGVDLLPNIDVPTVAVTVINPGASPEQIETEITKNIEGAVNTISGIDELRSSSVEGQSRVILRFVLEKNGDVAAQEVRDKVNLVIPDLPETALAPLIQKFDPGAHAGPADCRLERPCRFAR